MKKVLVITLGIVLAFVFGAMMLAFQQFDPAASFISMFKNSLFTEIALSNTMARTSILLLIGLSAFVGFNSGVTNLGQFGQLLFGALTATIIGLYVDLPAIILIPFMIIAAGIAGGLYASIAAFLKSRYNMNEFITTLMLNFVAEYFITYLVTNPLKDPAAAWPMSPVISKAGYFSRVGLFDMSVILSVLIFAVLFFYWKKTKRGYEFRMTGANNIFSRIGGCEISKNFYSSMIISGFLAGIAGAFLIMGSSQQHKLLPTLGEANAGDGLMVAIIAGNSFFSVIFFSAFFSLLQTGAVGMQLDTNVPMEFTIMLQALMVLFVVAFRDYSDILVNKVKARFESRKLRRGNNESAH